MSTPYNGGNDPLDPNDPNRPNGGETPGYGSEGYQPYPEHPQGSHPENDYPAYGDYSQPGVGGAEPYGTYNEYSAFDVNSAASMAGATALRFHGQQLTDNVPGDGQTPHPINDPQANGWFHTKGTGKLKVFEAIGWGFKATFSNAKLWLVLGLIYLVISMGLQFIPTVGNFLSSLAMLFFAPWMAAVALQETLVRVFSFNEAKAPAFGKTVGVAIVIGLISTLIVATMFMIFAIGALSGMDFTAIPQTPEEFAALSPEEMFALLQPVLTAMGVSLLVAILVGPFFLMQTWYAADNNGSFGSAIGSGFRAGVSNYLPLLGMTIMMGLIAVAGLLLFGVGLIVAVPVITLSMAHAYRQISAGPVPQDVQAI